MIRLSLAIAILAISLVAASQAPNPPPPRLGWSVEMTRKVHLYWVKRDTFEVKQPVLLDLHLDGQGNVLDTRIRISSGNEAFDQSARDAARAASPMPIPSNPQLLEADGKTIKVKQVTLELRPRKLLRPDQGVLPN